MKIRIGSIFIPVTDLERSIKWYAEHLGLQLVNRWENNSGAGFSFEHGDAFLGLVNVERRQPTDFEVSKDSSFRNCYYNFEPEDVYAMHTKLKENDVEVTDVIDYGPMVGFDFFDPDGNCLSAVRDKQGQAYYRDFD
ncbi:VOC family protein [Alkalihalobacillus sp. AL-G]|uniref:VOC family protein n=1 Tax=Alkalihalobacillus sp. AL-G TaxID=2926399 RepID=UPI00272B6AA6|nr:VOC family protein [Alkalihalobacillus sp. AL-G]WLD92828.1 VOC family protein [Alkalihalobacillus sp. AL-G]